MKILKFIKWLLKSTLLGLAMIFIIGAHFSLNIPVNIYTIAIVGTLRIPGLVMILIFLIL